jgi:tripartite-type tricarboxylate transporter receptor subunit TctC
MKKRFEKSFMSILIFLGIFSSLVPLQDGAYGSEDKFPSKPIQLYSGLAAGGTVGTVSTAISMIMPKYIGQPVVVNYKPGAMQVPAADFVAKSKPDGYTLFTMLEPDFTSRILQDPPVDIPEEDFVALGGAGFTPFLVVTCKGTNWQTLEELIADAKSNPAKYTFGSTGIGGTSHIVMEVFQKETGIKLVHVPFKGGAPRQTACLGGHIDTSSSTFMISGAHIKSGEQRALVIFDDHRNPKFPNVPTFKEKGYPGKGGVWQKICAPKGLSKPIYDRLVEALQKTFHDPEFAPMLSKAEIDPVYFTPEESNKKTKEEYTISYEILKRLGLLARNLQKK